MTPEMFSIINNQAANEFHNAFVYLSISNFYAQQKYAGLAMYYKNQYTDETTHAIKLIDYLLQVNIPQDIKLPLLTPTQEWTNLFMPLDAALALEQSTTEQLKQIMETAITEKDYATQSLLQKFIDEQIAEENQCVEIIAQAKIDGSYNPVALRLLNDSLRY